MYCIFHPSKYCVSTACRRITWRGCNIIDCSWLFMVLFLTITISTSWHKLLRTLRHRNFRGEWKIPPEMLVFRWPVHQQFRWGKCQQPLLSYLLHIMPVAASRVTSGLTHTGYPNFLAQSARRSGWTHGPIVRIREDIDGKALKADDSRGSRSAIGWVSEHPQGCCHRSQLPAEGRKSTIIATE